MASNLAQTKPRIQDVGNLKGLWRRHPRYRGCIGHWPILGNGGSQSYDISNFDRHGTITSAPFEVAGRWGKTLSFDGVDDRITVNTNFPSAVNLTMSFWMRHDSADAGGDQGWIVNHFASINAGWGIKQVDDAVILFDDIVGNDVTVYSKVVADDEWHNVVAMIVSNDQRLWIDGQIVGQGTAISGGGSFSNIAGSMYIGSRSSTQGWWQGAIDDVRMYNRQFSNEEIISYYRNPRREFAWAQRLRRRQRLWSAVAAVVPGSGGGLGSNLRRRRR